MMFEIIGDDIIFNNTLVGQLRSDLPQALIERIAFALEDVVSAESLHAKIDDLEARHNCRLAEIETKLAYIDAIVAFYTDLLPELTSRNH